MLPKEEITAILDILEQGDIVDRKTIIAIAGHPLSETEYQLKMLQAKQMIENFLKKKLNKIIYLRSHGDTLRILTDTEAHDYAAKLAIEQAAKKKLKAHEFYLNNYNQDLSPEQKEERLLRINILGHELGLYHKYRRDKRGIRRKFNHSQKPVLPPGIDTDLEDGLTA